MDSVEKQMQVVGRVPVILNILILKILFSCWTFVETFKYLNGDKNKAV